MQNLKGVEKQSPYPSAEEFLAAGETPDIDIDVPELGANAKVSIRAINVAERAEMRRLSKAGAPDFDEAKFLALTVLKGMVNPKLDEKSIGRLMATKNDTAMARIAKEIWKLSRMVPSGEEAKNESRVTTS